MGPSERFSTEYVRDLRRWRARWLRKLRARGLFRMTSSSDQLVAVVEPTVRIVRERMPELSEVDAVGQTLRHIAVMVGGGAAPVMELGVPFAVPIVEACQRVLLVFLFSMTDSALRLGWIRESDDAATAVDRASRAWAAWMMTDPAGKNASALFLDEVWSGAPHARHPREDEWLAVSLCMFVAKKSQLPDDIKEAKFREFAAPLAETVDAMARREAPRLARQLSRSTGRRVDEQEIRARMTTEFFTKGHKRLLAIPKLDGRIIAHPNTILGGRAVVDARREDGEARRRRSKRVVARSLDSEAEQVAAADGTDPVATVARAEAAREARALVEEIRAACDARGDATTAALMYIRRKEHDPRTTRQSVAREFSGVTVRQLRRAEDWIKCQPKWRAAFRRVV